MIKSVSVIECVENTIKDYLETVEVRQCDVCKKYMIDGYCIEEGNGYYCDDECMLTEMTMDEFNELYDDGNGDSYYTDWEVNQNEYLAIKEILKRFPEITSIKLK